MRSWLAPLLALAATPALAATLARANAYGGWRSDAPGVTRLITAASMPPPGRETSAAAPRIVAKPPGAGLKLPPGFTATVFARLHGPRQVRVAPDGDVFVAESDAGRVRVLRDPDGAARPSAERIFAQGLDHPFGIAFYPLGSHPQWVYVATPNSVVRFPYRNGDLKARGPAQTVVARIATPGGEHWTRDLAFSDDGRTLFVSVGAASNDGDDMPRKSPAATAAWQAHRPLGAGWGREAGRADVLAFTPDGKAGRVFATGLRNCTSMAINPADHALWCVVNERDGMGADLPPDYATQIRAGQFFGWPWFYIGDHPDPRHKGERPDLAGKAAVPQVLIQPHSAPLGMAFYQAKGPASFPAAYQGDAFVTLHGSWDRVPRTGYKVVRLMFSNGRPTGAYQDFLTGFVASQTAVWGRPVGVAEAHDGSLMVSDDGGGVLWRIAYGKR